jgi:hypothetical protein
MSVDYEYLGLEIVNSKISKNKERATVLFRALFKKENAYMAVEENAIFLRFKGEIKEGFSGRTVYSKDGKNPINTAPVSDKFDTAPSTSNKWSNSDSESSVASKAAKKENETVRSAISAFCPKGSFTFFLAYSKFFRFHFSKSGGFSSTRRQPSQKKRLHGRWWRNGHFVRRMTRTATVEIKASLRRKRRRYCSAVLHQLR